MGVRVRLSRRAQSLIEYVFVLGVIASALVAMQVYVKRGIQAKVKDMTDAMLPPGQVDAGLMQLSHVNPVIPMLDEDNNLVSRTDANETRQVSTQDANDTIVYDAQGYTHFESKLGQSDPNKELQSTGTASPGTTTPDYKDTHQRNPEEVILPPGVGPSPG